MMKKQVFVIVAVLGLSSLFSACDDTNRPDRDNGMTTTTTGGTTGYDDDDDDMIRQSDSLNLNRERRENTSTTGGAVTTTTGGVIEDNQNDIGPTGSTGKVKKDHDSKSSERSGSTTY